MYVCACMPIQCAYTLYLTLSLKCCTTARENSQLCMPDSIYSPLSCTLTWYASLCLYMYMYYHHTCPPCFLHLQGLAMLQCRLLWPVEGARRRMPPCPFAVPPCLILPCLPLAASWMRTAVWALHRGHLRWERTCCAWCTMSLDVCQLQCTCTCTCTCTLCTVHVCVECTCTCIVHVSICKRDAAQCRSQCTGACTCLISLHVG